MLNKYFNDEKIAQSILSQFNIAAVINRVNALRFY